MDDSFFILFGLILGAVAFLLWMMFQVDVSDNRKKKEIRGYCPVCGHDLRSGERIRSNQVEIGKQELRTFIKGCPFCMPQTAVRKRVCPVCKKKVPKNETIVAFSNPEDDRKKLSIRGCKKCYERAFD